MRTARVVCSVTLVCLVAGAAGAAEGLVTVRLGEQDTCKITGVTTAAWDAKAGYGHIRFDLGKFPHAGEMKRAVMRFWVAWPSGGGDGWRTWGFDRWNDPAFDGFKVYDGDAPAAERLLDVQYPLSTPTHGCFEFDVTKAVRQWLADSSANRGLGTNFRFPVSPDSPAETAWQRPYLEVTCEGPNPDRPRQPADFAAFYRAGQVFLTWRQIPHDGAFFDSTYRVYRHSEPITAGNLERAECLGEVNRLSQLNYRRTLTARGGPYGPYKYYASAAGTDVTKGPGSDRERVGRVLPFISLRFNFVIDDSWPERTEGGEFLKAPQQSDRIQIHQGPMIPDDTGLFVHTVRQAGRAFYAVTSAVEGNENRDNFSAANALAAPVEEKVETPRPVLQAVFTANGSEQYGHVGKFQVREYVYWEGGTNRFHNEPSTPLCFAFHVPRRWLGLGNEHGPEWDRLFPPWILSNAKLAGYSVSYWDGQGLVMDTGYVPPTRLAPFPPAGAPNMAWPEYGRYYYGSRRPAASLRGGPWSFIRNVYGYMEALNRGGDPRRSVVRPYFENRRLFELDFVLAAFPADPNYVAAVGEGGALLFGIHHADRVGCVATAQERPWTSPRGAEGQPPLVGLPAWGLKNDRGENVWDWNDAIWLARKFPDVEWPFISICHSDNYDGADNWQALGFPRFYLDLAAERRGGEWWWCDIGDAPAGKFPAVPRNQAYPVLTNATCCQAPLENWQDEPRGTLNAYVCWQRPTRPWVRQLKAGGTAKTMAPSPGAIPCAAAEGGGPTLWAAVPLDMIDTPERFAMTLRISDEGLVLNGQSVPPCRVAFGAADVTPRRLQQFKVVKGRQYVWRNVRVATGQVLQSGVIQPDERCLLTATGFFVDRDVLGNRLVIEPSDGSAPPAADRASKVRVSWFRTQDDRRRGQNEQVEELNLDEYAARCRTPELVPVARPDKEFRIGDFQNARGFRDSGLYSQWGGRFDDAYQFPQGGRYRVEVETTKCVFENGAWPILGFFVDSAAVGERMLDSEAGAVHTWWTDIPAGRRRVLFRLMNNVFNEPVPRYGDQGKSPDRGFTLVGVRFVPLGPRPAASGEVYAVRIRARSVVTGRGVPIRMYADVLDPWGEPAGARPAWKVSDGATISDDGVFTAAREGKYAVTATAGGKADTVAVTVSGDAWVEDFDDEWPDGWRIVAAPDDAMARVAWQVSRQHGFVGALAHKAADGAQPGFILWEAGTQWIDATIRADFVPDIEWNRAGGVHGLAFRCRSDRHWYRFERRGGADESEFRLIRCLGGRETVLATARKTIAPMSVDRQTYPSLRYWSEQHRKDAKPLLVDRFEVAVRGTQISARVNGQEVLSAADPDGPQIGTVGLYAEENAAFDNISVRPAW